MNRDFWQDYASNVLTTDEKENMAIARETTLKT